MTQRQKTWSFAALLALVGLCAGEASAQAYPGKPIRYIVPMSAGSGADTMARIAAAGLSQELAQQVLVDNRTGAAGNIGAELSAKAPPDGYTLFQVSTTHTANVSLYKNLRYDLMRDFAPVTLLVLSPSGIVVHPSLPAKSVAELVKLAKARPGVINYASTGVGSATFLTAELFKGLADINLQHIPYRGGGEALSSVVTGETSVYFVTLAPALPLVQQGRLRLLAVSTPKRVAILPAYPTVAESGYAGFEAGNWFGIMAPANTPKQIISTVRSAAVTALNRSEIQKRMNDLVYIAVGDQPEQFGEFVKADIEKWRRVIREKGITAE
jgi:tripartite-type tricarboxylate transporter receptor subunit TctC